MPRVIFGLCDLILSKGMFIKIKLLFYRVNKLVTFSMQIIIFIFGDYLLIIDVYLLFIHKKSLPYTAICTFESLLNSTGIETPARSAESQSPNHCANRVVIIYSSIQNIP